MAKNARWICLNHPCGAICSSRSTMEWCTCGKNRLTSVIELPVPTVDLGPVTIGHVSLTGEAMIEICNRIIAERAAWRKGLGVPQGFDIPKKPIPPTAKECLAEIAIVSHLEREAYQACLSLPPGPEHESFGVAMVAYRDRRIWLACAIRDGEVNSQRRSRAFSACGQGERREGESIGRRMVDRVSRSRCFQQPVSNHAHDYIMGLGGGRPGGRRGDLTVACRFVSSIVQDDIIAAIIQWPESHSNSGCHLQALVHYVNVRLNAPIGSNAVLEAIEVLRDRQLIENDGPIYRIREPDCREHDLYDLLETEFMKPPLRHELGLRKEHFVFQRTATGGPLGSGLLSKPDFTLAAIQSWRFDPERTLEVYSFEVKNRASTALKAVYEAVAHGRFVHHPYLVCPRSRFNAAFNAEIETACVREGVGLILFDLSAMGGSHTVDRLELVVRPQRRSPDPWLVQQHLESRLVSQNQDKLAAFATGAS